MVIYGILENDRPGAGRFWRVGSLELRIATASVRTGFAMTGFLQGVRYGIGGRTEASAPTERVECLRRAGDRKGRPYGSVTRGAVKRAVGDAGPYAPYETSIGRADVGSELSAAGGRSSEVSEWPRSKFPASAVRQHRNFGYRNRIIGPYGEVIDGAGGGGTHGSRPAKVDGKKGRGRTPPLRIFGRVYGGGQRVWPLPWMIYL